MKAYKLVLAAMLAAVFVGCNAPSTAKSAGSDMDLFRTTDVLDDNTTMGNFDWTSKPAGESTKIERSYENAPPLIPHDISDIIPITTDNNMCVTCHMPEVAKDVGATPVPKSHLYSIRFKQDKGGELSPDRFSCTQCHVTQTNATPRVKNNFKPEYRDENSAKSSNLLDVLNEGVR